MTSVLIIDDNAVFREVLRLRFTAAGYETAVAPDGRHGWELARSQRPDVVLLDLVMPEVDGVEFLRRLRNDPLLRSTPVLVISALSAMEPCQAARRLGIQGEFVKSRFSLGDLVERVQRLTSSCQAAADTLLRA